METQGKVVAVMGDVVEVDFDGELPGHHELLVSADPETSILLEVIASVGPRRMQCVALSDKNKITRGMHVQMTGQPLMVPVGEAAMGRVMDIFGRPHDGGDKLPAEPRMPLYKTEAAMISNIAEPREIMETGIKAIDFFTPLLKGGKTALIGGAGVGKTIILTELAQRLVIQNEDEAQDSAVVFSAVGERSREAHELHEDLARSGILQRTTLILGGMGTTAAIRFRTAFAGATVTEYLRDTARTNVMFFMDNLYRFAQAGYEIATNINTIPSEDGYQATLSSEMAQLNERLHASPEADVTSFMTLFVPSDDLTDYGVRAAFPFLNTLVFLSREVFQTGRYPAIDFLTSTSSALQPSTVGEEHYQAYIHAKQVLETAKQLERIVSLVGEAELSIDNQKIFHRSLLIESYMKQDFYTTATQTGKPGRSMAREETIKTMQKILKGQMDEVSPDQI